MIAELAGTALLATPVLLALSRRHQRLMRVLAVAACALPFLLPLSQPFLRSAAAVGSWVFLIRTWEYTHDHEDPRSFLDFLLSMLIPAVIRWETPRQPNAARARRALVTSLMQLGITLLLLALLFRLAAQNPAQLVVIQLAIYFSIAGVFNLLVMPLALRGLDYDDPFDNPLASRTPGEFWGRRWNTWVNHLLYRYAFVPSGGRRHPIRGTLAAFGFSGAFHEAIIVVGTLRLSGWMFAFFIVQGLLVIATLHWRSFRRLARRAPMLTWALTLVVMLSTGLMFIRGAAAIDPTQTWHRYAAAQLL